MSKKTFSIPDTPTAAYDFQRNAIEMATANAGAWRIPEDIIRNIHNTQASYLPLYATANNKATRSPAATAARDEAWRSLAAQLETLYDTFLVSNSALSAADVLALGIHSGTHSSTPTPAAVTTPVVSLVAEEIGVLHPVFSDSAAANGGHAKPVGVAFCEIAAKIDGPAPTNPADCTLRYYIPRSHESIVFEPEQRGKQVYGYARWVNRNGKAGVWSAIFSAMIP